MDGYFVIGTDINHFADGVGVFGQEDHSPDGIFYEIEIASGGKVPGFNFGGPVSDLGDDGGDNGPGGLSWAVCIKRSGDSQGESI